MRTDILKYIVRFILLVLLQVFILNNIQLGGYINPYAYILFLIILPVNINRLLSLLVAFGTGIIIDTFSNSMGLHTSACLMLAFVRPAALRLLSPRDGYETDAIPSITALGFRWFLLFALLLTLAHHFTLFYLEVFRLSEFFTTLMRIMASSIATVITVVLVQYLFSGQPASRL
jgi:rod shape-determining protein MreD